MFFQELIGMGDIIIFGFRDGTKKVGYISGSRVERQRGQNKITWLKISFLDIETGGVEIEEFTTTEFDTVSSFRNLYQGISEGKWQEYLSFLGHVRMTENILEALCPEKK